MPFEFALHLFDNSAPFEVISDFLIILNGCVKGQSRAIRYVVVIPILYRFAARKIAKIKETPDYYRSRRLIWEYYHFFVISQAIPLEAHIVSLIYDRRYKSKSQRTPEPLAVDSGVNCTDQIPGGFASLTIRLRFG